MKTERKDYTVQEKLEWYENKLTIALATGGAAKNIFEKIYYAEMANDIKIRIKQLLEEKK